MRLDGPIEPPPILQLNQILAARVRMGRISLPVESPVGYARLRHIRGVPATGDGGGFSLQRLQVIDSLIERLARIEERELSGGSDQGFAGVAQRLHEAIRAGDGMGYGAGLGLADVGTFLSIFA